MGKHHFVYKDTISWMKEGDSYDRLLVATLKPKPIRSPTPSIQHACITQLFLRDKTLLLSSETNHIKDSSSLANYPPTFASREWELYTIFVWEKIRVIS
jgi:hypothetical protein